mmetsp:Transcript_35890/g.65867  ORF Transcript_35890/g.65867 Transcript_35890/m.65867 type:complete len:187 (+) Transcript_35890:79-639(+)
MPMVEVFTRNALRMTANKIHGHMCEVWQAPAEVLKVVVVPILDQNLQTGEEVFVNVRAKAKPERTQQFCEEAMEKSSTYFYEHGHAANIRVELYNPDQQWAFFRPPHQEALRVLGLRQLSSKELNELFNEMDVEKKDVLQREELMVALTHKGFALSDEAWQLLLLQTGRREHGNISRAAFLSLSFE